MNDKHLTQNAMTLAAEDRLRLESLRKQRRAHRQAKSAKPPTAPEHFLPGEPSRSQRLADAVAATVGSWRFIIFQSTAIVLWIVGNAMTGNGAWDPYPFILLNLLLSFQAAYTAPAIMMSQNRQSEQDRRHAETDYEINVKAELEIELLHEKIDLLKERELLALTDAVHALTRRIEGLSARPT
ncbi:hypothetical protein GmRootV213_06380 [Variovorax sp. V213]|uniref:DUF1003 domain-containing protein n=1 Tax=Variovorax sp. V213 TaxID=3065955 RepID=UPI0034E8AB89